MTQNSRRAALALLLLLTTSPLYAQFALAPPPGLEEESIAGGSYGLGNQDLFVPAAAFTPEINDALWTDLGHLYYAMEGGSATGAYIAPLYLPAGARITLITCYFYDNDTSEAATVRLIRASYSTQTENPDTTFVGPTLVSGTSNGGFHRVTESFDETVRYRPSAFTRQFYTLGALMPPSFEVRFRGCNVTWNRQVTPAPASATFTDVPVGHPYHRFVEALSASGITAGCSPTEYCVNAPITRGEMAVFLAAALGLHFPN